MQKFERREGALWMKLVMKNSPVEAQSTRSMRIETSILDLMFFVQEIFEIPNSYSNNNRKTQ